MVFSSITFIYLFLPLVIISYFLVPKQYKNYVLLLFSLFFYYYGEKKYLLLLIFSCIINYTFGLLISKETDKSTRKIYLIIDIIINLLLLVFFKYFNFLILTLNSILGTNINTIAILLPLGISFFTFQNISYIVDIYRKDVPAQKNILKYATYITFFPQLIAGPIVRYKDVNNQIENRTTSINKMSEGINRFIIGLSKKVLISNALYEMINSVEGIEMTFVSAWILGILYTLQIYFDFSGYSDMAIGLGKIFGFTFPENFNYPLTATSITDFWRRWHMTLSSFFRDYIYIPLGGNRVSKIINIRNLFVVWLLTGLWHGAAYNFILWGLYFLVFLLLEKFYLKKYLKNPVISHLYTIIIVTISFIIFQTTDMNKLKAILLSLFNFNKPLINNEMIYYLKNMLIILPLAIIGSTKIPKNIIAALKNTKLKNIIEIIEPIFLFTLLLLITASLVSNSFNPFIYYRF